MGLYDVYRHTKTNKFQAVKQGFCWPAFFTQSLWAFSRRLYLLGIFLSALVVMLLAVELLINPDGFWIERGVSLLQVAVYALIAYYVNDARRWFLKLKGYQKKATIEAKWPSAAIKKYISSMSSQNSTDFIS